MKTKLFLGALLTTSLLLSGCTISIKPDYQEGDGDNTPVDPVEEGWDENTKALMENALHGYVIPYFDFLDVSFECTEKLGMYFVEAKVEEKINYSYVAHLAGVFIGDGFEMVDYYEDQTYFTGGKVFAEYNASINVAIAAVDEEGYVIEPAEGVVEGYLKFTVYNSYLYEWSDDIANYLASQVTDLKEGNVLPPELEGDYYEMFESYNSLSVYLDKPEADDAGYSAILTEAGWNVLEEKDDYGYYIAIAPDESYRITYLYEEDYGSVDIYFESYTKRLADWPADSALAFAKALSGLESPLLPPAFTAEGGYEVYKDYKLIYCYTASETEDAGYSAILTEAGWNVLEEKDSYGYFVAVAPDESYQVSYLYDTENARLRIYFEKYVDPTVVTGMTPEEIANGLNGWFGTLQGEVETGVYYIYGAFDASDPDNAPEELASYIDMVFEYMFDEFTFGEWGENDGALVNTYANAVNTTVSAAVYVDTIYVDGEGYIVPEGTEGATAVEATIVEVFCYTAAE